MPHSNFKERYHPLKTEVAKCTGGKTFVFRSGRDQDMNIQMHNKVCSGPVKGCYKQVRVPQKSYDTERTTA